MAITGSTNKPAPQNRKDSEASGAAALATVIEYGIIYGQNRTASVAKDARKNSTVIANGQASRRCRAATKIATIATRPIAGKINPQRRPRNTASITLSRSAIDASVANVSTTSTTPARRGTLSHAHSRNAPSVFSTSQLAPSNA